MIVKAQVFTNSAQDPEGKQRVKLYAPSIWETPEDSEDYIPSLNAIPLNVGDVVFVYIPDNDFVNPLILGKSRDNNFASQGSNPENFAVLFESVSQPDPDDESTLTWSVLYVQGSALIFENSAGYKLNLSNADLSIEHENFSYSLDGDGNISASTNGTIDISAEGQDNLEPVPLGDTLKAQLEKLSQRLDQVIDLVGATLGAGVPAPMDGGAALKSTMKAAWDAQAPSLKQSAGHESWEKVLNKSIKTAGNT